MTIKTRNHINIALIILSFLVLALQTAFFLIHFLNGKMDFSYIKSSAETGFFLTKYNPYAVILSIFIEIIYVIVAAFVLYRSFEKTQSTEIIFFYIYLVGCLADSFRLWIPVFKIAYTYSKLLILCGNATLFGRLVTPLALLCTTILGDTDYRQDVERNCFILIFACLFFASFIPLNTAIVLDNFCIDYSFKKIITSASVIIYLFSVITLAIKNHSHKFTQITTIGFALTISGEELIHYSASFLSLIAVIVILTTGSVLYLKELHRQYLWND